VAVRLDIGSPPFKGTLLLDEEVPGGVECG
jgi:hypothetical protein